MTHPDASHWLPGAEIICQFQTSNTIAGFYDRIVSVGDVTTTEGGLTITAAEAPSWRFAPGIHAEMEAIAARWRSGVNRRGSEWL